MARLLNIELLELICTQCSGKGTFTNPEWTAAVGKLSPEQLAAGTRLNVPQSVACDHCHGMMSVLGDDFWLLAKLLYLSQRVIDREVAARYGNRTPSAEQVLNLPL